MTEMVPNTRRRPQGERGVGDVEGDMHRAEARAAFWPVLQRERPDIVAELLNIAPAREAIAAWPQHQATHENAYFALAHVAQNMCQPLALDSRRPAWIAAYDRQFDEHAELLGPMWRWPYEHVWRWCADHNLESPELRADAMHTVMQNFCFVDGDMTARRPWRPTLDPFEIPPQVRVYRAHASMAEEEIELREASYYHPPQPVFNTVEARIVHDAMSELYREHGISMAVIRERADEIRAWIDLVFENALARSERALDGKQERFTIPSEERLVIFIRTRVNRESLQSVATDYKKAIRTIAHDKREVTILLGLEPEESGRPANEPDPPRIVQN